MDDHSAMAGSEIDDLEAAMAAVTDHQQSQRHQLQNSEPLQSPSENQAAGGSEVAVKQEKTVADQADMDGASALAALASAASMASNSTSPGLAGSNPGTNPDLSGSSVSMAATMGASSSSMDETNEICRFCRCEGSTESPLYHPCICTGSIKFIHQECLVEWLRISQNDNCNVCNHRFSFDPIYSPNMPEGFPLFIDGVLVAVGRAIKHTLQYLVGVALFSSLMAMAPLTAGRIYRTLFTGSVSTILNVFSTENLAADMMQGLPLLPLIVFAMLLLCGLRERLQGGEDLPAWLEMDEGDMEEELVAARDNEGPQPDLLQNVPEEPPAPDIVDPADEGPGFIELIYFFLRMFWIVPANAILLIFAFCIYHIGNFALASFKMKHVTKGIPFEGFAIAMVGYCIIGFSLVILHAASSFFKLKRSARVFGLCYVVVKVTLLTTFNLLVFPFLCGLWLDVCSDPLFDASLKDRLISFQTNPWASFFMHWLVGMVYVSYYTSFVHLLHEVLRPGVLWFLDDLFLGDLFLGDPDVRMLRSPAEHLRRIFSILTMLGTSILVMVYCPLRLLSYLPYATAQSSQSNLILLLLLDLSLDLSWEWRKLLVRKWCGLASWALGITPYMFGDVALDARNNQPEENQIQVLHVADPPPEVDQREDFGAAQEGPYKPAYFSARICGLLAAMVVSLFLLSLVMMVVTIHLILPCVTKLGLAVLLRYIASYGPALHNLVLVPLHLLGLLLYFVLVQPSYPFLLGLLLCFVLLLFLKTIHEFLNVDIRNDRYLVGRKLVNYDHQP